MNPGNDYRSLYSGNLVSIELDANTLPVLWKRNEWLPYSCGVEPACEHRT